MMSYITTTMSEIVHWMDLAIQMAEEALQSQEVPVGCVFVRDGVAIAKARNRTNELKNATRHAELEAIDAIISDPTLTPPERHGARLLSDTTLYVTVEPCIMCASALRQVGIKEVYFGCGNDRFGGCGGVLGVNQNILHPTLPPYPARGGFRREEAILLLRRFYITENAHAPVPRPKTNRVLKREISPDPVSGSVSGA